MSASSPAAATGKRIASLFAAVSRLRETYDEIYLLERDRFEAASAATRWQI